MRERAQRGLVLETLQVRLDCDIRNEQLLLADLVHDHRERVHVRRLRHLAAARELWRAVRQVVQPAVCKRPRSTREHGAQRESSTEQCMQARR